MPAMLLRPWIQRVLIAGSLTALSPAMVFATWPWGRPAPQPAIPVGPPIYSPNVAPMVTNYQPTYTVPSNQVPAALAPTLIGPPTTFTPAPAVGVAPPQTIVGQPALGGYGSCQSCGVAPRVTGYVPPTYSTNFAQVPATTYRPVVSVDPATGLPINAVQPCTTNIWQARRVPNTWWGGLWPATSAPPSVVAYTPATIAAYPQARITNYAPPVTTVIAPRPVVTQYAPAPVVTQYAPQPVVTQYAPAPTVTQYAPAPVPTVTQYAPTPTVTQYAPAPVPTVTQYAPAPTVTQYAPSPAPASTYNYAPAPAPTTNYAPAPVAAPATQPCPHGCPHGHCQEHAAAPAPATGTTLPSYPQSGAPQGSYPNGTIVPNTGTGREPASIAPRLDSGSLNGTTRSYTPSEYDNEPVVPVAPPVERRVIETPRIEAPQLQQPGINSSGMRPPTSSPFIPFARPVEKPASTVVPQQNLRLVPDPDADKLDLRREAIPNLIKPGDRSTQAAPMRHVVSVPMSRPAQPTTTMKPVETQLEQPRVISAALPAGKLDESGWRSVAQ